MQAGCSVTCLQSCPLQMFGLKWSTSNTWPVCSLFLWLRLLLTHFFLSFLAPAELHRLIPSSPWLLHSTIHELFPPPRSLSYPSPVISLCLLSVTVTSNPLFYFLYVLPFLDLRAWRWLDLIMLGDPHLISHVREILKQVNLPVLRGKDTPLHFLPSWIRCDISWAGIKVE